MIHVLEPRYDIPSRPFSSNVVVPKIYQDVWAKVESDLKMATFVALTTHGRTSRATKSYNTVTTYFIYNAWQMKGYGLQTRNMGESHTGENLAVMLNTAINERRLVKFNTKPPLTTDNATSIVNTVSEAELHPHVRCFAHTINLATQRVLKVSQVDRLQYFHI